MSSVILEVDTEREVLSAFLADTARDGEWKGEGDFLALQHPGGKVSGVSIRHFRKWANNRMVLADLIARTLGTHRDDVVDALLHVRF